MIDKAQSYRYTSHATGRGGGHDRKFERKLDPLKNEFKGAAKETPTCAVPRHAPQMSLRSPKFGEGWRR